MRLWRWWLARCFRQVDVRPLALVRVLLPMTVFIDLMRVAQLGLIDDFYRPYSAGGINKGQDSYFLLDDWLGPVWAGPIAWGLSAVCMLLISLGIAVRPAILAGVLIYAQLGHSYPAGDRGIDRFVRTVLLILLFSGVHRRFTRWGKEKVEVVSAWSYDLIRWVMVMMYMSAGVSKLMQQPRWLAIDGIPVVYRIMTDPMAAHMDPVALQDWYWPLRLMGWATIAMELTPWLIFTRFAPWWGIFGVGMHLGIIATMELGMFGWSMLALYPILFAPWLTRLFDRLESRG